MKFHWLKQLLWSNILIMLLLYWQSVNSSIKIMNKVCSLYFSYLFYDEIKLCYTYEQMSVHSVTYVPPSKKKNIWTWLKTVLVLGYLNNTTNILIEFSIFKMQPLSKMNKSFFINVHSVHFCIRTLQILLCPPFFLCAPYALIGLWPSC